MEKCYSTQHSAFWYTHFGKRTYFMAEKNFWNQMFLIVVLRSQWMIWPIFFMAYISFVSKSVRLILGEKFASQN